MNRIRTRISANILNAKDLISTRKIAFAWAILFIVVLVVLIPIFQPIFQGEWVVKQEIVKLNITYLNIFNYRVPFEDVILRYYSVVILVAFIMGYLLSLFLIRRSYLPENLIDRFSIGFIVFGLLGARVLYVLFNLDYYQINYSEIPFIFKGGISILGGLIAGLLYLRVYTARYKFNFYEIIDILAPGLLLAQIIGRLGNFFNYEAYGGPTNLLWKMYVPEQARAANKYEYSEELAQYFHPTFLYDMILGAILLYLLLYYYDRLTRYRAGLVGAIYLIFFGLTRFVLEFFRLDTYRINTQDQWYINLINSLPDFMSTFLDYYLTNYSIVAQLFALGFTALGILIFINRRKVEYSKLEMEDVG